MSALEPRIDALYALPLDEFTAARNALAKALTGEERAQVKRLEKPTVVPWVVNQIYWHERSAWNKVISAGRVLRAAQLAALEGTADDLREASAGHRSAVSSAVAAAQHLAERHGARPATDELARMLEAISLTPDPPATPGRFTQTVQPAGFEALAGFTPALRLAHPARTPAPAPPPRHGTSPARAAERAAADAERARAAEAARAAAQAAVDEARARLAAAEADAAAALKAAEAAKRELVQAEHAAQTSRVLVDRSRAALAERESRLRSLDQ